MQNSSILFNEEVDDNPAQITVTCYDPSALTSGYTSDPGISGSINSDHPYVMVDVGTGFPSAEGMSIITDSGFSGTVDETVVNYSGSIYGAEAGHVIVPIDCSRLKDDTSGDPMVTFTDTLYLGYNGDVKTVNIEIHN